MAFVNKLVEERYVRNSNEGKECEKYKRRGNGNCGEEGEQPTLKKREDNKTQKRERVREWKVMSERLWELWLGRCVWYIKEKRGSANYPNKQYAANPTLLIPMQPSGLVFFVSRSFSLVKVIVEPPISRFRPALLFVFEFVLDDVVEMWQRWSYALFEAWWRDGWCGRSVYNEFSCSRYASDNRFPVFKLELRFRATSWGTPTMSTLSTPSPNTCSSQRLSVSYREGLNHTIIYQTEATELC